jgi:hypothetical protein
LLVLGIARYKMDRCRGIHGVAVEADEVGKQSGPPTLNLQLWYGDVLVADLLGAKPHQGTWSAEYRQVVCPEQGPLHRRLCEFIVFCEEWHQRLRRRQDHAATEFDQYEDVIESGLWQVPCPDGTVLTISAPGFVEGEASWNHPYSGSDREAVAGEMWSRLTR